MPFEKRGLILAPDGRDRVQVPTPIGVGGVLRVYFSSRDPDGRSRVRSLDTDPEQPSAVALVRDAPVLDLGAPGAFDHDGSMPSCAVEHDGDVYLYYTAWERRVAVPYSQAIGLAVSTDGGVTFERAFDGPIVDRTRDEPYFATGPFVLREPGGWRMWYASTTAWAEVGGAREPVYAIRLAHSDDGISWRRGGETCIVPRSPEEANGRPWVIRDECGYRMWYSHRSIRGFRDDPAQSYRIGYAVSEDGVAWARRDEDAGITISDEGWDSDMVAYAALYRAGDRLHMLYNGNGFGATGIGYAIEAADPAKPAGRN